jgi:hypothetical protein
MEPRAIQHRLGLGLLKILDYPYVVILSGALLKELEAAV